MTDELLIMKQTFFGPGRRLPMVPSLIDVLRHLGVDPWWGGKFIAMVSGVLIIVPTFYMTRKLTTSKAAPWVAALMVAASPLIVRWSFRAMTDITFTLFLTAAIAAAVYWVEEARSQRLALVFFFGGLAMLTRPEGLIALPMVPALFAGHLFRLRATPKTAVVSALKALWGLIPWGGWIYWREVVNQDSAYSQTMDKNIARIGVDHLGAISQHFGGYSLVVLYILGPIILVGCLMYLADLLERFDRVRFWAGLGMVYVIGATWFIACVHFFFSTRHLVFSFPTCIAMAMVGIWAYAERFPRGVRALVGLQLVISCVVLAFGLWVTRDTFRDVKEAALAAREGDYSGVVYATDFAQIKTEYYYGGKASPFRSGRSYPAGTRVLLDSYSLSQTGMTRALAALRMRHTVTVLHKAHARQGLLLADDLAESARYNGNARFVMSHLFKWQQFQSLLLELSPKKIRQKTPAIKLPR